VEPPVTTLPVLFAQDTTTVPATGTPPGADGKQAPPGGMMGGLFFPLALFALFYFVVIFPMSRRQKKEQANMMASIKRGSKVALSSGIVGTIQTIKDGEDEIVIRSEDAKIRVLRSSITRVLGHDENEK
jgi:preprotein translocase subunit YajC